MSAFKSITLYALPFAGGNALSYRVFSQRVDPRIRLCPLELPGRNKKMREPLAFSMSALTGHLFEEIRSELHEPYALFGHSMGALLSYLLAARIAAEGLPLPAHLFCSGRRAPSLPSEKSPRHLLSRQAFFDHLDELGGIPDEVRRHEELMDFFEPIIRADFQANDTYRHERADPLPVPLTVLYGDQDRETPLSHVTPWQQETTQALRLKAYRGGHFFLFDHVAAISEVFAAALFDG